MKPVNTALLSFGMSGKLFHAPFLQPRHGFHFYAVWERSKNLAQETYPSVKTYRMFEELLADDNVELVIVNTPNYTHYEYTKKALESGKHVVVEKPFTVTTKEGEELIELSKKTNRILSVYHNRRYDSDYKAVKKIVQDDLLGKIVEAEFHFDRYKEDLSPKVHKETPGPGNGALYDLGSHLIDQALQLFGMPDAVFADIEIVRPASQVDDFFEILMYYPGKRVRLRCSYLVREPLPGYVLHGIKGSFIKAKTNVQEIALQSGIKPGAEDWGKEPDAERGYLHTEKDGLVIKEFISTSNGNYMDFFDGIYRAIRNGELPPVTAEDALDVIRIIEAAFMSSKQRRVIEL